MMESLKAKLTYANVMATVAVFIALGGASYAATQLPKNSVGTKQLKNNSVSTAKVKKEAITADKVKNGTLTGTEINVSTLGTVPSAVSAQSLGGMSADQIVQSSKLQCPGGTELAAGACFETSERPEATYEEALEICGMANRSLPGVGELAAYALTSQQQVGGWAGSHYTDEGNYMAPVLLGKSGQTLIISAASLLETRKFLCSTPATN